MTARKLQGPRRGRPTEAMTRRMAKWTISETLQYLADSKLSASAAVKPGEPNEMARRNGPIEEARRALRLAEIARTEEKVQ